MVKSMLTKTLRRCFNWETKTYVSVNDSAETFIETFITVLVINVYLKVENRANKSLGQSVEEKMHCYLYGFKNVQFFKITSKILKQTQGYTFTNFLIIFSSFLKISYVL